MSGHGKNSRGNSSSDGRTRDTRSNFFQQSRPVEASAKASCGADDGENVSAAILTELQMFRRENNEKLETITSTMNSLEQSLGKMGERMTEAETRIEQVEEGSARSTRLLGYLLRRERQLEERCEELENYTRRNNLRVYGVGEGCESGDMVQWTEAFLRELLGIPASSPLQLERAHRSLQQRPADANAPPRSLVVRFVNHQHKQQVLAKAWQMKNLQYKGKRIYMDHDYTPTLQKKRREYAEIKRQLREKNIRFQTPYPAKLRVHLTDGAKTFSSAWEAAEGLLSLGIRASVSEDQQLERDLDRIGWRAAASGAPRRVGVMSRGLIRDVEALQKDMVKAD